MEWGWLGEGWGGILSICGNTVYLVTSPIEMLSEIWVLGLLEYQIRYDDDNDDDHDDPKTIQMMIMADNNHIRVARDELFSYRLTVHT